jgi:uncharacterized membrane protein
LKQRSVAFCSAAEGISMCQQVTPTPSAALPQGYRQGFITAITVFLGFSLSFLRFWSLERSEGWTWKGIVSACIIAIGIVVQLFALLRSLDVRDDESLHYATTVRCFFAGIVIVVVGVVVTIIVVAYG